MGFQTVVFGYIQTFPARDNETRVLLRRIYFDPVYPFPNLFHGPYPGYQWSTISFAGSFKDFDEELSVWLSRFENLLVTIQAFTAEVAIVSEKGRKDSIEYVRILKSDNLDNADNRTWLITTTRNVSGIAQEEERIL